MCDRPVFLVFLMVFVVGVYNSNCKDNNDDIDNSNNNNNNNNIDINSNNKNNNNNDNNSNSDSNNHNNSNNNIDQKLLYIYCFPYCLFCQKHAFLFYICRY